MDEKKKVIFVERGKKLSVECLVNRETKKGFFLVTDENNNALMVDEIVVGDRRFVAVVYTRTIYKFDDGIWVEEREAKYKMRMENKGQPDALEIPSTAPLPN